MDDFASLPPCADFDSECRDARDMAESLGLLSVDFALCEGLSSTEVRVTNRRLGLTRRYPRKDWLPALREELHDGLLGPPQSVAAAMKRRQTAAR